MWRLVGVQGVYSGRFFDLDKDSIRIGKGDGCGVSLAEDQSIADNQAEILLCNGSYVFKDLDSTCPTTVNGTVSTGMVTLSHGDMVQIGESVFRVEQTEVPGRATACASPRTEPTKGIELSASMLNVVPWKLVTAVLFVTLVIAAIAIPNIRRANERHRECMRMAQEAVAPLKYINSELKVGISYNDYNRKIVEAQTKIDAYTSKFSNYELDGLGTKLLNIQQAYVDAGELWDFAVENDRRDTAFLALNDPYLASDENLYRTLTERYPDIEKHIEDGGAKIDDDDVIVMDNAKQIIWNRASEELSTLRLP